METTAHFPHAKIECTLSNDASALTDSQSTYLADVDTWEQAQELQKAESMVYGER